MAGFARVLLVLLVAMVSGHFAASARSQEFDAKAYCRNTPHKFVSCADTPQSFSSVVIAIHGWNGHCDTTFGGGDNTLHQYLDQVGFYDIDCFEYDTSLPVETNAGLLHDHIQKLVGQHYHDFIFVTHSLGGVVLLQMLADDMLNDNDSDLRNAGDAKRLFQPGAADFRMASIWASPINGILNYVSWANRAREIWGYPTQISLKQIYPKDSAYLQNLRSRLAHLADLIAQKTDGSAGDYDYHISLYQGQGQDWVVNPIDGNADQWIVENSKFPVSRVDLTRDDSFHSSNLAQSTSSPLPPFYPEKLVSLEGLAYQTFSPRIEEVFPIGAAPSANLVVEQAHVINGGTKYIDTHFENAFDSLAKIFDRVAKGGYPHEESTDKLFASSLIAETKIQATRAAHSDDSAKSFLRFAGNFICSDALSDMKLGAQGDYQFGLGSSHAGDAMLELVKQLQINASDVLKNHSDYAGELQACGSADQFNERALAFETKGFHSGHDTNREVALSNLDTMLPQASLAAVKNSGVVSQMTGIVVENPNGLAEPTRVKLSGLLLKTAQTFPQLRPDIEVPVSVNDQLTGQPTYARIFNDQQLTQLQALSASQQKLPEDIDFSAIIANNGGTSGNNPVLQLNAGKIVLDGAAEQGPDILKKLDFSAIEAINPDVGSKLRLEGQMKGLQIN